MASESVAVKDTASAPPPDDMYTEQSPYERVYSRLNGLNALSVVAQCALDSRAGAPTQQVWEPLWYFVGLVCEDMKRDMQQHWHAVRAKSSNH